MCVKNISFIFLFALVTNFIWENLHASLYGGYQGGEITEFILTRASFWDAVIIVFILLPFLYFDFLAKRLWIIFVIGFAIAVAIEWYALSTNRWSYNEFMPIIPFLETGLTPTIQLGFLAYATYVFLRWMSLGKRF